MSKYEEVRVCMNINQINNIYNTQAFKGLWNKTTVNADHDKGMGVFTVRETTYYHPYSDETRDEIASVVKANSNAYIDNETNQYKIKECRVCTTLPMTKKDYEEYAAATNNTLLTEKLRNIHIDVRDKYTDNEWNNQKSAVNESVKHRISIYG